MKCEKCNVEMSEGYKVKLDSAPLANIVLSKKMKSLKVQANVCPMCGKVELYTTQPNAVKTIEED